MRILAVVGHPRMETSRVHRAWMAKLEAAPEVSVRPLYALYSNWKVDTLAEQETLAQHDRIVLQFPFYLYSAPPLMKKWLEDVFTFGWAYGPGGDKLKGKEIIVATTTGGPRDSYQPGGFHNFRIEDLLLPYHQLANLVGARYLRPHVLHRARTISDAEIQTSAQDMLRYVLSPS